MEANRVDLSIDPVVAAYELFERMGSERQAIIYWAEVRQAMDAAIASRRRERRDLE